MAKYVRVTTPVGNASYPWLKQPDTKFNPDGLYSCNIIVDKDKAQKLITIIDKAYDDNIASEKAKAPNKKIKLAAKPYDEQEGNKVLFKIKTKAKIGDVAIRPHVVDAKGQPIINTDIFGGSEVKVSADLIPYYVPANGAGISLRLIEGSIWGSWLSLFLSLYGLSYIKPFVTSFALAATICSFLL